MNNKAFTLVELLGVLVLLSIIAALIFPAVSSILTEATNTVYQKQINTILNSTYDFSLKDTSILPQSDDSSYITLGQLKYEGLIDLNITNPNTNDKFPDNLVIRIKNVSPNYNYDKANSKLAGNYLYTILFDNLEQTELFPSITLTGLTKNSNNNYILTLDLNDTIQDISYTAESKSGVDLTDKVISYIIENNTLVDSIDSSKPSIYKVNYIVVDDNGYAVNVILNIIVADTTKPTITLPRNNTIPISQNSLNLLKGVECVDNSGFCDITYSGTINYGTPGKYIIEYTGIDPSGNSETIRRVITIE